MELQEYTKHVLDLYTANETHSGYPIARALTEIAEECSEFVLSVVEGKDSVIEQKHEMGDILYFLAYLHYTIREVAKENDWEIDEYSLDDNCFVDYTSNLVIDFTRASMMFSKALKRLARDMGYVWDEKYLFNLAVLVDDMEFICDQYVRSLWSTATGNIYQLNIDKLIKRRQPDGSQITARERNAEDAL